MQGTRIVLYPDKGCPLDSYARDNLDFITVCKTWGCARECITIQILGTNKYYV